MFHLAYSLQPADEPMEGDRRASFDGARPISDEDLPYRVEVWDPQARFVELVAAVTAHPAIGFAAYYAAAREFPGRDVTLRHRSRVLSRWTARSH